jgi:dTDP-4-amino-4,6-dideoxygalactose transaminase
LDYENFEFHAKKNTMRIGRTLPPAAALITLQDLGNGLHGFLTRQREVARFQNEIQDYFQVKHCFLLSSGKAALTCILQALHSLSPERDEVLIPAFTCYSVPSAIVRAGLKVRLSDVDPQTLDFDPLALQVNAADQKKLLAVVSPHLFGRPADIAMVQNCIQDHGVRIIEDAAQAMGGTFEQKYLGAQTGIGFFSLGRGKAFSTVQGGIIITQDDLLGAELNKQMLNLKVQNCVQHVKNAVYAISLSCLMHPSFFWIPRSVPGLGLGETIFNPLFPMQAFSPFQAGLARNWKKRISDSQQNRKQNVLFWQKALSKFTWLQPVQLQKYKSHPPPLLRYPVLVNDMARRKALLERSNSHGLGIMPTYPNTVDAVEGLEIANSKKIFSGAKQCIQRLVTFPVHAYVQHKDRQRILTCLKELN